MIGWREGAAVSDRGQSVTPQITPFPTGRIMSALYQAFHAWLLSFGPSGTKVSFLILTQMRGRGAAVAAAALGLPERRRRLDRLING
jgi:hypothetical protein